MPLGDISALASNLRHAKMNCRDVIGSSLDLASASVPDHVFRHLATEQAEAEARHLDATGATSLPMKPLAGVPFGVAEFIAVDGLPLSAGTRLDLHDLNAPQGAVMKKLRDSGAVPIGKTAGSELSLSYYNSTVELPDNPHYPEPRLAGGPSSGSAVAVAKGICSFALSRDAVGATRVGASLCGVTGFRPSVDFWPRDGSIPLSREFDTMGVLTRQVSDLAFLIHALGGGIAPNLIGAPLRLGVAKSVFFENIDPAVAQAVTAAFARLSRKNIVLSPIVIPDFSPLKQFVPTVNSAALVRYIGRERLEAGLEQLDPATRPALRIGLDADINEVQNLYEARRHLVNKVNSNFSHIDAIVAPTLPETAPKVSGMADADAVTNWQRRNLGNVQFANLFNMAAISIPLPGPEPIGLQLMATAGNELKLIGVAHALQQALVT